MSSKLIHRTMAAITQACVLAWLPWSAVAADGAALATETCASCHALEQPDFGALGVAERFDRKAPPLYFAGNKYRQEWLLEYLQNPQPLHPIGYFPNLRINTTDEGDLPASEAAPAHPQLGASEA